MNNDTLTTTPQFKPLHSFVITKPPPPKKVMTPEEQEETEIKLLTGILLSKKDKTTREILSRVSAVLENREQVLLHNKMNDMCLDTSI